MGEPVVALFDETWEGRLVEGLPQWFLGQFSARLGRWGLHVGFQWSTVRLALT